MENKNTVIALALMLVVWVGFAFYTQKNSPSETTVDSTSSESGNVQDNNNLIPEKPVIPSTDSRVVENINIPDTAVAQRDITIDTDYFTAVLNNAGASIKSFTLKKYRTAAGPDSPFVNILENNQGLITETLITTGSDSFVFSNNAVYSVNIDQDFISIPKGQSKNISFSYVNPQGILIQKIFTFSGDGYDIPLQIVIDNTRDYKAFGKIQLSLVAPWDKVEKSSRLSYFGPATLVNDKVKTDSAKDLVKESKNYGSDAKWTAIEDEYFMSAIVPLQGSVEKISIHKSDSSLENVVESSQLVLEGHQKGTFDYLLYFGPRDLDILKVVNHDLSKIIDFGFFDFIARPLLHVLKFFYSYVGNYGIAIILLTIIIKLIFWPLTQKSYASMKAMQTLQPEMQKIREKYKNDKERLNREIMELYKTKRVNPLGGCLPMLIQIPVFFALYKVLLGNIALRHAPFVFWLTDLSAKDPYYITPLIMGGTMFLQQKMSPSTMDPTQAKMFMIMPVVFTFLFLNFPSGLVIYWLVNNILTILQQYLINKGHKNS